MAELRFKALYGLPALGIKAGELVPLDADDNLLARYIRRGWVKTEAVQSVPVVQDEVADNPAPKKRGRKSKR